MVGGDRVRVSVGGVVELRAPEHGYAVMLSPSDADALAAALHAAAGEARRFAEDVRASEEAK